MSFGAALPRSGMGQAGPIHEMREIKFLTSLPACSGFWIARIPCWQPNLGSAMIEYSHFGGRIDLSDEQS